MGGLYLTRDELACCTDAANSSSAGGGEGIVPRVAAILRRIGEAWRRQRLQAETRRQLARLDERTLEDIGYRDADLAAVVETLALRRRQREWWRL